MYKRKRITNYYRQPKIFKTSADEASFRFSRKFFIYFGLIAFTIYLVWFLFYSQYFKVKEIVISGSLNSQVKDEINKLYGQNTLLFRPGKMEKVLATKQTSIDNLEILKGIPDILKVKVNVRVPIVRWKSQDKIYFIDSGGIIFELNENEVDIDEAQRLPLLVDSKNIAVTPGNQIIEPHFINFICDLYKEFPDRISANINEIIIGETTFQVEVLSSAGWRVYFDTSRDLVNQLIALRKVLDNYGGDIKEYIDLRVEGQAYYK